MFPTGQVALIDRQDLLLFASHAFYPAKAKYTHYLIASVEVDGAKRTQKFHRMLLKPPKHLQVDHINCNGLDNRRSNLRVVTAVVNINNRQNLKPRGGSLYFGVAKHPTATKEHKWACRITYEKKTKRLGIYDSEVEAAIAWNNYVIVNNLPKRLNVINE
ncbi:MAG: HNH endonuclease [Alphaproteobacteria bacterium]|nr:HNH endonuclease [Alphaproteobacteria bacterium]